MSGIREWLDALGLGEYAAAFEAERITLDTLPHLTESNLKELGLPMGPRAKVLSAAKEGVASVPPPAEVAPRDAERRQITVMFCDLVGSTALSESLDPEELSGVMQAYRRACTDVIERYEGHVAQYLGDGVMIYFGWPVAHEDDAQRAVRAGLEIVDVIASLEAATALEVRVGIATGLVVVGESGAESELAVGETPNVAARVQALADSGTVAIAQSTRHLVGGAFALEEMGAQALKGIGEAVTVWRVSGKVVSASRFESQATGSLTPFVGREHETGILLERWGQVKDGEGQVVLLSGEPGIGKSRMVQVLNERLSEEPLTRIRYQCSPYYTNSAFYPLITQIERASGFAREDTPEQKLDKLEATLAQGTDDVAAQAPFIAGILSLPLDRYPPLALPPQKQKELAIAAFADQVVGLAAQHPVLMIFEDAHWIDPTTLEAIGAVIERIEHAQVLLLITYRPEFEPPWSGHGHIATLALTRLSRRHGQAMVGKVTGGKALPDEVLDQIVAKTDGVPLFVEELTKTVLEGGHLAEKGDRYALDKPLPPLAIPATLQDSLMARLDRLAPVKEVAQIGACIGREFEYELLATVSPLRDNELQAALQELVNSELIFRRGMPPDAVCTFKHALVQDAAYESLLRSRRQQLHASIAAALVTDFSDLVEQQPERVGYQYTAAAMAAEAVPYWHRAADRAAARFANVEAINHVETALGQLAFVPDGDDHDREELSLRIILGASLIAAKGYSVPEVALNFLAAKELSESLGEIDLAGAIWLGLHRNHVTGGDVHAAHDGDQAFHDFAVASGHPRAIVTANWALGASSMWLGFFPQAAPLLHAAYDGLTLDDEEAFLRTHMESPGVTCRDFAACTDVLLGYPDRALETIKVSRDLAEQLKNPFAAAFGHCLTSQIFAWRREAHRSLSHADAAINLVLEFELPLWGAIATIHKGASLVQLGQVDAGAKSLADDGLIAAMPEVYVMAPSCLVRLAEAKLQLGDLSQAREAIDLAFHMGGQIDEGWTRAERHRVRAALMLAEDSGDLVAAEAEYLTALDFARDQSAKWFELKIAASLAGVWREQGRIAEAIDILAPVHNWFTEGFDTADLSEAKALLNNLR
jgi:class 3 adenylate cyclase